jgi:hypothetical protein
MKFVTTRVCIANSSFLKVATLIAKRSDSDGFPPFLIMVSMTERNIANISAPRSERNPPDTFCFTFRLRIARSKALLSYGTCG